jgi:hypothetical protein
VARSDLAFLGRIKALRREVDERAVAAGARARGTGYAREMPPWATETMRLGSSVGRDLSTEALPAPTVAPQG